MATSPDKTSDASSVRRQSISLALAAGVLGLLALISPVWPRGGVVVEPRVGLFLILAGGFEVFHGFRRPAAQAQRSAWIGGAITMAIGVLLFQAPFLTGTALLIFFAGWFAFDAIRHSIRAVRARRLGEDVVHELIL